MYKRKIYIAVIIVILAALFVTLTESLALPKTDDLDLDQITVFANQERTQTITLINKGTQKVSWYGPKFHGKLTANGEIYDQMSMTAAHKTLPFGTMFRITNPNNNKSVIVRINDRGPYIKGREIDLSKGAAIAIGMMHEGVIHVQVEELVIENYNTPVLALH